MSGRLYLVTTLPKGDGSYDKDFLVTRAASRHVYFKTIDRTRVLSAVALQPYVRCISSLIHDVEDDT